MKINLAVYFADLYETFLKSESYLSGKLKLNWKERGYIYLLKDGDYYKIGKAKRPKDRLKTYRTENPRETQIILCEKVSDYTQTEKELLSLFKSKNHKGEWFKLDSEDIDKIKKYISEVKDL
jgi:hypothetical protein